MPHAMTQMSMSVELRPDDDLNAKPTLGMGNYLNAGLFFAATGVLYAAEFTEWFGDRLSKVTQEHQTILSARMETWDSVFLIWHAITVFELFFVLIQLTPGGRSHDLVKRITPWWVLSCSLQIAWVIVIMQRAPLFIPTAIVAGNFTALLILIGRVEVAGKMTFLDFWGLRAPFSIHAGYLWCQCLVYVNAMLQENQDNKDGVVIGTSVTGMTAILTITTVLSMAVPRPDGLFCAGVAWYFWWVYQELSHASPDMPLRLKLTPEEVSDETLAAFAYAAGSISFIAGCETVLSFGLRVASCFQKGRI